MTDDSRFLSLVTQVLDQPPTKAPDRLLSSVLDDVRRTPQRRPLWPPRRSTDMHGLVRYAIGAAAVMVVAIVGFNLAGSPDTSGVGSASPSAVASPSDAPVASASSARLETPAPSLPWLSLPGIALAPAGEYGWEGRVGSQGAGSRAGMHRVNGESETALTFQVGDDCLGVIQQRQVPVRLAGFDGVVVEPHEPPVPFGRQDNAVTRAYKLLIGDRSLCVFLTWNAATTADDRESAERTLDTLRAEPVGTDRVRITFTLDEGWDTG
jgi:hypothetical protein